MGRCKSLRLLKSFLWYAPWLSRASILLFSILNPLRVHHGGGVATVADGSMAPISFVYWNGQATFFVHSGSNTCLFYSVKQVLTECLCHASTMPGTVSTVASLFTDLHPQQGAGYLRSWRPAARAIRLHPPGRFSKRLGPRPPTSPQLPLGGRCLRSPHHSLLCQSWQCRECQVLFISIWIISKRFSDHQSKQISCPTAGKHSILKRCPPPPPNLKKAAPAHNLPQMYRWWLAEKCKS